MRKNIYLSILLILSGLLYTGCETDVMNPNKSTVTSYWKTEQDARYGLNAVYNYFNKPATFMRQIWFRLDITSDECFSQSPNASLKEWTQFIYNNYNYGDGNAGTLKAFYIAIFRANQVLHYVPNIEFKDDNEKKIILAQAHFLRGLYYYYTALLWGSENKSIALMLEDNLPDPKDLPEGHTEKEIYEQAIFDFTKALEYNIPVNWSGNDKGRATKGAALAYRAKVYMQLHEFEKAKIDIHWLVEGEGKQYYDLTEDYFDNFKKETENNIESVFEIQYSDVHESPANADDDKQNPNLGQNKGKYFAPPTIGWTDGELRPWVVDQLKKELDKEGNYDIRLRYTAFYEGMEKDFENNERIYNLISNEKTWSQSNWKGRVFMRKYGSDYYRDVENNYNPINIRLIRFADVLFMYAECIIETGDDLAKAVECVDRIRARVNLFPLAKNHPESTVNKDSFMKRLQMERTLELATEGYRWADIKRWGLLDTEKGINELKLRDADFDNFVIGKHNCLPIPSDEINNNPYIEQNPKY